MQHLLDFIQEHTLEEHLYFVAQCPSGELELIWRRAEQSEYWQLRPNRCEGPWELVHRSVLIASLAAREADVEGVKRELHAMLAVQIAFADMILRDANQEFGTELVQRFVRAQQCFIDDLSAVVEQLAGKSRPSMVVVRGGGAQSALREGHLSVVR